MGNNNVNSILWYHYLTMWEQLHPLHSLTLLRARPNFDPFPLPRPTVAAATAAFDETSSLLLPPKKLLTDFTKASRRGDRGEEAGEEAVVVAAAVGSTSRS